MATSSTPEAVRGWTGPRAATRDRPSSVQEVNPDTVRSRSLPITPAASRQDPSHAATPRSGPFPDQPLPESLANYLFAWSARAHLLYHQETRNMLVSYSPKKLGFF
ncbi:hypothetical protein Slala05_76590 [Streptomyces lavendulae subsp. lavendulae]|nr:hypothetical protein Slala05_76590 [Streptomyces lavendulae subsp. lavendulae]